MSDSDGEVGRLLERWVSKPPRTSLTQEEKKELSAIVLKDKSFRQLKDIVRLTAWSRSVPMLNADPTVPSFPVEYAEQQGFRRGMLYAVDLMEALVEAEDDDE